MSQQNSRLSLKSYSELYDRLSPLGLIPPQAVGLERSLLGAMLIDRGSAIRAMSVLGPPAGKDEESPFYRESNRTLYSAMFSLFQRQEPVDLMTVRPELKRMGITTDPKVEAEWVSFMVALTTEVVTTVNVESYAKVILEKFLKRQLIRLCEEIKLRGFEDAEDAFQLQETLMLYTTQLGQIRHNKKGLKHVAEAWNTLWKDMATPPESGVRGLSLGIDSFDEMADCLLPGLQVIIAAQTSRGKTALAVQLIRDALDKGLAVYVFSLETTAERLLLRMLIADTGYDKDMLMRGEMPSAADWVKVREKIDELKKLPLYIDDSGARTPFDIRNEIQRISSRSEKPGLVVVDYLQLVTAVGKHGTREQEVTSISRDLRAIWKDFNVVGCVLAQFNRKAGDDKEPTLSDIRESGAVEQDARVVIFLHYPYRKDEVVIPRVETVRVILAKNTDGPVGSIECDFHKHLCMFTEKGGTIDAIGRRKRELQYAEVAPQNALVASQPIQEAEYESAPNGLPF